MIKTPLQMMLVMLAGWINRRQLAAIDYLREENRVLREKLGKKRVRLNDDQRRRLAARGKVLGRRLLADVCSIVTPDTILRWHRRLIARKQDGNSKRQGAQGSWTPSGRLPPRWCARMSGGAIHGSSESWRSSAMPFTILVEVAQAHKGRGVVSYVVDGVVSCQRHNCWP